MFKLYDCDVGIKIEGVNYKFPHVVSVAYEDAERNKLTRGGNDENKIGIAYKEGITEPKRVTIPFMQMSIELKEVLDAAFDAQTRMEVFAISRSTGSSKMAKNAILSNRPMQLNLDDTAESLQVSLEFETFDLSETLKA